MSWKVEMRRDHLVVKSLKKMDSVGAIHIVKQIFDASSLAFVLVASLSPFPQGLNLWKDS
jgi:hypothetical protein